MKKDILFIWSFPYKKCWVSTYTSNILNELRKYKKVDYLEISFRKNPIKSFFLYILLIHLSFKYKNIHFQYTPLIWWPFIWLFIFIIRILNKNVNILITTHEKNDVYIKHLPHFLHIYYKIYEKQIYKNANLIIVLSEWFKSKLIREYNIPSSKIKFIQHWVYIRKNVTKKYISENEWKYWLWNEKINYVWFLWFIRENKWLDTLINYFNTLKLKNTKLFIWWLFNDNNYRKNILNLIDQNKENIILYQNFLSENDFSIILNSLNVLILPYQDITQSWIVNYAISYNVPLLLKETLWISEINEQNEIGSTFNNFETFKTELEKLLFNSEYIESIKEHQLEFYNNFNFETLVKNYFLSIYK